LKLLLFKKYEHSEYIINAFDFFKKLLKAFRPSTALAKYSFQTLKKYKRHVLKYKRHVKRP